MNDAGSSGWFARLLGVRTTASPALEAAITQVIDGVDPRLRLVRGYARRLLPALERVLAYFDTLMARIPPAVEFSERRWTADPLLRLLFADTAQLKQVFSASHELREFFRNQPAAAEAFVGLSLTRHEQRISGMALAGETVQRDVMQTAIGFSERLVVGASISEAELRGKLKTRCLNFLIAQMLERLARERPEPEETEDKLKLWLRAREHERCALDGLFCTTDALDREIAVLRDRLAREARFAVVPPSPVTVTLDEQLDRTCSALEALPHTIRLDIVRLRVDHNNIRLAPDAPDGHAVAFSEATIGELPPRTVVLARVPREELLREEELLERARRLLA